MPPHVSRKRTSPAPTPPPPKRTKISRTTKPKKSVFDSIDESVSRNSTPEAAAKYLSKLEDSNDESDEQTDFEFEDVPGVQSNKEDEEENGEEMDWEDAIQTADNQEDIVRGEDGDGVDTTGDVEISDVQISLTDNGSYETAIEKAANTLRKGLSKRERQVRNGTHCAHVQAMMFHNVIRNSWLNDKELQGTLLNGLPEGIRIEIDKWREDMGLSLPLMSTTSKKAKRGHKRTNKNKRGGRDWDVDADRLDKTSVNMSRGDPTLRILRTLVIYWRKRFVPTCPGIRKIGYMPLRRLTQEINSWKKNQKDFMKHGERIENVQDFRRISKLYEGSRDVGAQLFTALLRGLGLETRMISSLQPPGIGWGKIEEAKVKAQVVLDDSDASTKEVTLSKTTKKPVREKKKQSKSKKNSQKDGDNIISLDTDSDDLSSAISLSGDDSSVVDVTLNHIKKRSKKYDRDLHWPVYWSEVLSPVSNTWVPVDAMVLATVATNGELLAAFEPRGKMADTTKQVICYVVAHSTDGSAKDVTVRYLKKNQFPGRTKGFRVLPEKIKILDRRGKVQKIQDHDWFHSVISILERPVDKLTYADGLESSSVLNPILPTDQKSKIEMESLQWYKQSAEFVLERHLRREEAILPNSKPVKQFTIPSSDKKSNPTTSANNASITEPVYRRSDVVACKTIESWHKEGRQPLPNVKPLKLVPMRAVTTTRKREIEEIERDTGEKPKQGLFSREQTEWIIPPPIGSDRIIPVNAFNNIDIYVPSMVPKGAVHIPRKGTARICRDLKISFAEACTGFEFGKRMAIPVITGVVVAEEHEQEVLKLWREREAERKRKEEEKRRKIMLGLWKKFLGGLRIVERIEKEYEHKDLDKIDEANPFVKKTGPAVNTMAEKSAKSGLKEEHRPDNFDGAAGGGFVIEREQIRDEKSGGDVDMQDHDDDMQGGFIPEDGEEVVSPTTVPISLQAAQVQLQKYRYSDDESITSLRDGQNIEHETSVVAIPPAKNASGSKRQSKTSAETTSKYFCPPSEKHPGKGRVTEGKISKRSKVDMKNTKGVPKRNSKAAAVMKSESVSGKGRKSNAKSHDEESPESEDLDNEFDGSSKTDVSGDSESEESEEAEVVKPRQTTARTRGKQ